MLWGGLGWVLGGPIGAIIGYSLAGFANQSTGSYSTNYQYTKYPKTQPGDYFWNFNTGHITKKTCISGWTSCSVFHIK